MATSRIFCELDLQADLTVTLDTAASHHLATVLRAREGETVCLFNGDGNDYFGVIETVSKKSVVVKLENAEKNTNESPLHTSLIQGVSRNDRMDFTLQKATELGVNRVIAFRTDLVNQRVPFERLQKKTEHWQAVMRSAAEQSGRARVPDFQLANNLQAAIGIAAEEFSSELPTDNGKWVLIPGSENTLAAGIVGQKSEQATSAAGLQSATLVIGPERGLSDIEQETAIAAGFKAVALGPRILRTETAPLAAISVIQTLLGDFS